MNRVELNELLTNNFEFTPTTDQKVVLYQLSAFILSQKPRPTYILQGYAGTGKTSLVTTLVKTLPLVNTNYVLLAPTGRAAKVLSNYSGKEANTIHRKIYYTEVTPEQQFRLSLAPNKNKKTVYIVDEASMIGNDRLGNNSLLDDLISYVFSSNDNKLLIIGDKAQLPPVNTAESPALNINYLRSCYDLTIASYELKDVMRQSLESGILYNATKIRKLIAEGNTINKLNFLETKKFNNVSNIEAEEFQELLYENFNENSNNEAVIICKSNKRANIYNQAIRNRILNSEGLISTGDKLMVVKNNYYWKDDLNKIGFIANGDIIEIKKIKRFEEMYDLHFADVEISLIDYENQPTLEVRIILDTLTSESPALSKEESEKLYREIEKDYQDIEQKKERYIAIKNDKYFNALQVKFAYALTCHKTQGGQWNNVFIDSTFNQKEELTIEDLRWLYTAGTRAIENMYLINFKPEFFNTETEE